MDGCQVHWETSHNALLSKTPSRLYEFQQCIHRAAHDCRGQWVWGPKHKKCGSISEMIFLFFAHVFGSVFVHVSHVFAMSKMTVVLNIFQSSAAVLLDMLLFS